MVFLTGMCGRYTLTSDLFRIKIHFGIDVLNPVEFKDWKARYNIAPGQDLPVIVAENGKRLLRLMRWGLIPSWAKDEKTGFKMINARAETAAERPAFKDALIKRRCIVPADGFYEWKTAGKKKFPIRFTRHDKDLFGFAGLWDRWRGPDGRELLSFTILTTNPNEETRPVHDRMPVILTPECAATWLDPETRELEPCLRPYPDHVLKTVPVSPKAVNSPKIDAPECIAPWEDNETQETPDTLTFSFAEPAVGTATSSRGGRRAKRPRGAR